MSSVTILHMESIDGLSVNYTFKLPEYKGYQFDDVRIELDRSDYMVRYSDMHRLRDKMEEDARAKAQGQYDTEIQRIDMQLEEKQVMLAPSIFRETKATGIEATLEQRGKVHGDYENQCAITNAIKSVIREANNWSELRPSQQEALDMFATKMGRILEGDPNHPDHWHDIAGYATLVENTLVPKDPNQIEMSV